jgi:hypothetical protein
MFASEASAETLQLVLQYEFGIEPVSLAGNVVSVGRTDEYSDVASLCNRVVDINQRR